MESQWWHQIQIIKYKSELPTVRTTRRGRRRGVVGGGGDCWVREWKISLRWPTTKRIHLYISWQWNRYRKMAKTKNKNLDVPSGMWKLTPLWPRIRIILNLCKFRVKKICIVCKNRVFFSCTLTLPLLICHIIIGLTRLVFVIFIVVIQHGFRCHSSLLQKAFSVRYV